MLDVRDISCLRGRYATVSVDPVCPIFVALRHVCRVNWKRETFITAPAVADAKQTQRIDEFLPAQRHPHFEGEAEKTARSLEIPSPCASWPGQEGSGM